MLERIVILHHGRVREHTDLDELRRRAIRLSGRTEDLDRVLTGGEVLRRSDMGSVGSALVTATPTIRGEAAAAGIDIRPVSVHDLVAAYGMQSEEVSR